MTTNPYQLYDDGADYDRLYDPFAGDRQIAFYRDLATRTGGRVLELTCGTGRIAIPLARLGFAVTGVDRAEAMLAEARRKAKAEKADVTWHPADICDFDLGGHFGLILLPSNALCHLLTREDFTSAMRCVRRHLHPDGRFVVNVFVPAPALLGDGGDERFPSGEFDTPEGRVVVTHTYRYEHHTQIRRSRTYYAYPDGREESGDLDMRMYFPQELDALLEYNGLQIEAKYAGFDGTPFGDGSTMQLVVCSPAT